MVGATQRVAILNVSGDDRSRRVVTHVLRRAGYEVTEAATGEESLRAVAEAQPDLIVLDATSPAAGHPDTCRLIKERSRHVAVPILHLVSAEEAAQPEVGPVEGEEDGYLARPIDPAALVSLVGALLRARDARLAAEASHEWEATFDALSDAMCVIDLEGRVLRCNRAMVRLVAKPIEEIIGGSCGVVLHELYGSTVLPLLMTARGTQRRQTSQVEVHNRWYQITIEPLPGEGEALTGAVLQVSDVTERQQAARERERLLAEVDQQRTLLGAVLRQMPAGVVVVTPSGLILFGNEQMEKIWGRPIVPPVHMDTYGPRRAFHPDGRPYEADEWPLSRAIKKGERVVGEEVDYVRPDGSRGTLLINAAPVRDAEGKTVAGVVASYDITERKQGEKHLARLLEIERERARDAQVLDIMLEAVPTWFAYIDRELSFVRVNTGFARALGRERSELIRRSAEEFFRDAPAIVEYYRQALHTGEVVDLREAPPLLPPPEGATAWPDLVDALLVPIKDMEGRVDGLVIAITDVTDKVRQREQQVEHERAARQLAEALALDIAHRVKNNLIMIAGLLQMQISAEADSRTAATLHDAVVRLLSFADIHAQINLFGLGDVDILEATRRIAEITRRVFSGARVEMSVEGEPVTYPSAAATAISIVANELITNAIKHGAPAPDGARHVRIELTRPEGQLRLAVWNSGNPVPPDFDAARQPGMGLRLVQDLAIQHSGSFTLRPEGEGTVAELLVDDTSLRQIG